jgi:hypothetical protein
MAIKKLIVVETEAMEDKQYTIERGYKYSHFQDPETQKWYRPKPSFVVTGENMETMFEEIDMGDIETEK